MTEYKKCTSENKMLKPCSTLSKAMEGLANSRAKGISLIVLSVHGTPSRSAAVLRSGDFKKDGIIINFCPFCGENVSKHFVSEVN